MKLTITLNEKQIKELNEQFNQSIPKFIEDFTSITSYEDACIVLNKKINPLANSRIKLKTIIKAINRLIDDNTNFPDWTNNNEYKYSPYFTYSIGSGWSFDYYNVWSSISTGSSGYLKSKKAAEYVGKNFINYYSDILNEKC